MTLRQRALVFATVGLVFVASAGPALALCCKCKAKADPSSVLCLTDTTGDCASIITKNSTPANNLADQVTCDPPTEDKTCKKIGSGDASAVCAGDPIPASSYKPTSSAASSTSGVSNVTSIDLVPNVAIPGLTFAQGIQEKDGYLEIPFLAQYLAALFNYVLGITVIAAAVMIVWGGFKYILAANVKGIQDGKDIIKNALMGLLLVFGTVTILQTVNSATAGFRPLRIAVIRSAIEQMWENKKQDITKDNSKPVLTKDDEKPGPPPEIPDNAFCGIPEAASSKDPKAIYMTPEKKKAYLAAAREVQKETGVPGAVILANWATESGFGTYCIGPPDKKNNCFGVTATPFEERQGPNCDGFTCPKSGGWPAMNCAPKCSPNQPPSCFCWKIYDNPDPKDAFKKTAANMKKFGWEKYSGNPEAFLKLLFAAGWAGTDYGVRATYSSVMNGRCFIPKK